MKTYGGVEVYLHALLVSSLDIGEWSASRPDYFTSGRKYLVPIAEDAGWTLKTVWPQCRKEKFITPVGNRTPITRRPPRSSWLYRLSCPVSMAVHKCIKFYTQINLFSWKSEPLYRTGRKWHQFCGPEPFLRRWLSLSWPWNSLPFMKTDIVLPSSQMARSRTLHWTRWILSIT
jgi:hypothetical protein